MSLSRLWLRLWSLAIKGTVSPEFMKLEVLHKGPFVQHLETRLSEETHALTKKSLYWEGPRRKQEGEEPRRSAPNGSRSQGFVQMGRPGCLCPPL